MKQDKAHMGSTGLLAGITIAILALARGSLQTWLLLGTFTLWGLWAMAAFLPPHIRQAKRHKNRQQPAEALKNAAGNPRKQLQIPETDILPDRQLLLRHVNHRISSYLKSAYPDATWEWEAKDPGCLAALGGTGRIRVFGIQDFSHADITLDRQANISCNMLKVVPLAAGTDSQAGQEPPPNRQPVDPQVWYETRGRTILETLVADLSSHGHSSLTLHENGDACVEENRKEVSKACLPGFPEKVYWPRLVQVLESNGLAAETTADSIRVSW